MSISEDWRVGERGKRSEAWTNGTSLGQEERSVGFGAVDYGAEPAATLLQVNSDSTTEQQPMCYEPRHWDVLHQRRGSWRWHPNMRFASWFMAPTSKYAICLLGVTPSENFSEKNDQNAKKMGNQSTMHFGLSPANEQKHRCILWNGYKTSRR